MGHRCILSETASPTQPGIDVLTDVLFSLEYSSHCPFLCPNHLTEEASKRLLQVPTGDIQMRGYNKHSTIHRQQSRDKPQASHGPAWRSNEWDLQLRWLQLSAASTRQAEDRAKSCAQEVNNICSQRWTGSGISVADSQPQAVLMQSQSLSWDTQIQHQLEGLLHEKALPWVSGEGQRLRAVLVAQSREPSSDSSTQTSHKHLSSAPREKSGCGSPHR